MPSLYYSDIDRPSSQFLITTYVYTARHHGQTHLEQNE